MLLVTIVPWVIINMSGLPLLGTSPGNGVSSIPNQSFNAPSGRLPEAQKGESLQSHDTITGKVASAASAGIVPSKHSTGVQRTVRARELRSLSPTPETRPTTIPGWTLREVTNGTALLEGPNGVWRVTPGRTVPSLGRVDSIVRWGNRYIVATSSGLISTP